MLDFETTLSACTACFTEQSSFRCEIADCSNALVERMWILSRKIVLIRVSFLNVIPGILLAVVWNNSNLALPCLIFTLNLPYLILTIYLTFVKLAFPYIYLSLCLPCLILDLSLYFAFLILRFPYTYLSLYYLSLQKLSEAIRSY